MHGSESDPDVIRSVAVTIDDVVTALEARRSGRSVVLRVTPPFHARMRARLHVASGEREDPDAIHLVPRRLFDDDLPAFPTPAETEDRLRASDREYTTEAHHDRHREAVDQWRAGARDHLLEELLLETPSGPHAVEVKALG